MTWTLLFLAFLHHLTGSCAQVVLTQPNSVSTSLRSTVKLSCKRSTGNIGSYYVHWYQQHEGRSPTTMIYEDDKRPDGVPDRFSGSIDSSSNSAFLTINNVQTDDEAIYFCQSSGSGINHSDVKHKGSKTKSPQSTSCEIYSEKNYGCFMSSVKVL